jgi:hypothetical protein
LFSGLVLDPPNPPPYLDRVSFRVLA